MTSTSVDNPANRVAEDSCSSGNADACALAGMSQWLDAQAKGGESKSSLEPFLSGCELDDWFSCAMAGSIQGGADDNATELAKKAYGLAVAACEGEKDASACAFLGDWAVKASATEEAKKHYSLACGLTMTADSREKEIGEFVCKRAIELGAAETELQPIGASSDAGIAAKRVSGVAQIHPPNDDAIKMQRLGVKRTGAEILLCLSEAGVPRKIFFTQFSEFPAWNQKIFETVRAWRYSPKTSEDGTAMQVCTGVTFVYLTK